MKIRDVMTRDVVSAHPETTLMGASELMRLLNIDVLPVVEDERVIGVVTDRDIVVRGLALGFDPRDTPLLRVMTRHPPQCAMNDEVEDVIDRMGQHPMHRLLVVDEHERLLGSVSLDDMLRGPNAATDEDEEIFVHARA